jgi:hypothetical protein
MLTEFYDAQLLLNSGDPDNFNRRLNRSPSDYNQGPTRDSTIRIERF